jgi:hypothetical protein
MAASRPLRSFSVSLGGDLNQRCHWLTIDQDWLVVIICEQHADHMLARPIGAMPETRDDQAAAKVAVHTVVVAAWDIAVVTLRINPHVDMPAARIVTTATGRREAEVALHHNSDDAFDVTSERHCHSINWPDNAQAGCILG